MVDMPFVSVVTPSYNSAKFILEAIESVRQQNYPSIEHIIMDGASTDGTQEILRQYPDLIWVSEPDRGQSHALNKNFRRAQGEIIGWLNADDSYNPEAVRVVVNFFQQHPDVDVVYSDCQFIDENGNKIRHSKSQLFDLESFLLNNYIKQPTVFMRKRVLDTVGGVDENLHYVMDKELWLRVGTKFQMRYLPEKSLANFRLCAGTKSFEQSPKFHLEWLGVLERVFQEPPFSEFNPSLKKAAFRKTRGSYHLANFRLAQKERNVSAMRRDLFKAIFCDWTLLLNRGIWYYAADTFFGQQSAEKMKKIVKRE